MTVSTGNSLLKQHPLSAAFPAMADEDFDALADDIKKHGQREKGVVLNGMVLDGWHRLRACNQAGVTFEFTEFRGTDPVEFVLSKNLHRRHLTASQRAAAIVAATNWRPAGMNSSSAAAAEEGETAKALAERAEVSTRTIEHAKTAQRAGLGQAVLEGKVSAETAAKVAKLPKARREKAKQAIEEGREPSLPKEKRSSADADKVHAELIDVQGKYADLLEKNAELADTARELEDRLTAFEKTDPDEQQKEIMRLQKRVVKLEAEVGRLTRARNDLQAKCNELIREVKRARKRG